MQNVSVAIAIVLGVLTFALWLGGAVWFMSNLHQNWDENITKDRSYRTEDR